MHELGGKWITIILSLCMHTWWLFSFALMYLNMHNSIKVNIIWLFISLKFFQIAQSLICFNKQFFSSMRAALKTMNNSLSLTVISSVPFFILRPIMLSLSFLIQIKIGSITFDCSSIHHLLKPWYSVYNPTGPF